MVLAVIVIGGTFMAAVTIAGLLMVYQLRAASNAASSARAIYAADAGIEWGLYQFFRPGETGVLDLSSGGGPFTNGAKMAENSPACYNKAQLTASCPGDPLPCKLDCSDDTVDLMRSVGVAGTANRAFELSFNP